MNEQIDGILITPEGEAERLWRSAEEALILSSGSFVQLFQAVELGVRVVEIVAVAQLQRVRHRFPATITSLLESPPVEVEPIRDFVHPPRSLRFVDIVDMLSEEDLPCLSQGLHRGWEDRVESCRRTRDIAQSATNMSIGPTERENLTMIGAYRNRLFEMPPTLKVVPADVIGAYPALAIIAERLLASTKAMPV